jgi:hypothetical protein
MTKEGGIVADRTIVIGTERSTPLMPQRSIEYEHESFSYVL